MAAGRPFLSKSAGDLTYKVIGHDPGIGESGAGRQDDGECADNAGG